MASFDFHILRLTMNRTLGTQGTFHEHDEIMNRLSVFKAWFVDHYVNRLESTIIALHIEKVQPRYSANNNPNIPGIRPMFLTTVLGTPGLSVPSKSSWVFQFIFWIYTLTSGIHGYLICLLIFSSLSSPLSVSYYAQSSITTNCSFFSRPSGNAHQPDTMVTGRLARKCKRSPNYSQNRQDNFPIIIQMIPENSSYDLLSYRWEALFLCIARWICINVDTIIQPRGSVRRARPTVIFISY